MNGIPLPLITEAGAEQRISQIIDHLNALAQETERMFTSIDFKNLNADLANRINSSLTEHQSLEEYASSAKLEKVREELDGLVTEHRDYVNNNFYTQAQMLKTFCTLGYLQANYWEKNEADGYFAKKSGIVSIDSLIEVILETFPGKIGELNAEATRKAYEMG